jgi:hypothetical protein
MNMKLTNLMMFQTQITMTNQIVVINRILEKNNIIKTFKNSNFKFKIKIIRIAKKIMKVQLKRIKQQPTRI